MLSKDIPNARRFRIWAICLLIVVVSASILFVAHLAKLASEPFLSVSFLNRKTVPRPGLHGTWGLDERVTSIQVITLQVTNRTSFDGSYCIESQAIVSGKWESVMGSSDDTSFSSRPLFFASYGSLAAHSQTSVSLLAPPEGTRLYVEFERKLKPLEISVLNKLPWLKKHYPFNRPRSFTIYEHVSDVHVSSKSKQQP